MYKRFGNSFDEHFRSLYNLCNTWNYLVNS